MIGNEQGTLMVVSLWARNVVAAAHFYQDVIGFRILPHHGHHVTFDMGCGAHLVILEGDPGPDRGVETVRWPLVAFRVANLDALVEKLKAHQIDLPWGIEAGSGSHYVMLRDPAGNLIELVQFS